MEASHKRSSMSRELMKLALKELQNARDHIYLLPENEQPLTEEQILNRINVAIAVLHQEVYNDANDKSQKCAEQQEPEALRLADALDHEFTQGRISNYNGRKAAAELRRLHEVNQDLLKALNTILNICLLDNGHWAKTIEREAHEAIAKATGEKS